MSYIKSCCCALGIVALEAVTPCVLSAQDILVVGCGSSVIADGSATPAIFECTKVGPVGVSAGSRIMSFEIRNLDPDTPLAISSITITGPDAGQFAFFGGLP